MERHFSDEQRILVYLAEYCAEIHPYRNKLVMGDPQPTVLRLMSVRAQATVRGLFTILDDLFRSGMCLSRVDARTFVVDRRTGVPLLSTQGRLDILPFPVASQSQMDSNVRAMGTLVRCLVFRLPWEAIPIDEVEFGLLPLMANHGRSNWPAVYNHPCLVPLENRLTFQSRIHQELTKVIWKTQKTKCLNVLKALQFSGDWHSRVNSNNIMAQFYSGSTYNTVDMTKEVQSSEILRFMRNGDQHGPDRAVARGATAPSYRTVNIAVMYYSVSPLLLHSLVVSMFGEGLMGDVNVTSLFCYPPP